MMEIIYINNNMKVQMILKLDVSTLPFLDALAFDERKIWRPANVGYYFIVLGEAHFFCEHIAVRWHVSYTFQNIGD